MGSVPEGTILKNDLLAGLPPEWPEDLSPANRCRIQAMGRKVVVLDDDPTGTQTVHDLPVLTRWTADVLRSALTEVDPVFYILTNSRSLPEPQAVALNREIATNLAATAADTGCDIDVISRSDSTLRGHFPAEIDALQSALEPLLSYRYDGILICPFFQEGGRLTVGDIHWVAEGEQLVPAAQTEFSRDVTFGYTHSNLCRWVEEKTRGRIPASHVLSLSLEAIRQEGPAGVRRVLSHLSDGRVAIVNAVSYRDLDVIVAGLLAAEAEGQRFLFRTAASFVKARGGIPDRGLLQPTDMVHSAPGSGLILVGSYIDKSSRQLAHALQLPGLQALELGVSRVLDPLSRSEEIARVARAANEALAARQEALIYTSRDRLYGRGRAGELDIGQQVSSALVEVVRQVTVTPRFIVAKGGITSSDIATAGLGVQRAWVLGQILPGVPVWRLGEPGRFPGLPYIVFPGNVGNDQSLAQVICILRGGV